MFQVWFNRLLESALEFNYNIEHQQETIKESYTVPVSHNEAEKASGTELKHWKVGHRAKANIKLSLGTGPCSLVQGAATAYEMIQILKSEYKIGSKLYNHRTLAADFVLQDKENPAIFFNKLEEFNNDFTQSNKPQGKDYKKDPTKMLMHIQQNVVGVDYDSVWTTASKHNLKEHWNKKLLKKKATEETDFIMLARSNDNKCKHCGNKAQYLMSTRSRSCLESSAISSVSHR